MGVFDDRRARRRYVELGAGVGVSAGALAARGRRGVATDKGLVLPLLRRNLDACAAPGGAWKIVELDFARPFDAAPLGAPTVLLAADVLYSKVAAAGLPGAVSAIPSLREVWLAHTVRDVDGDGLSHTLAALSTSFPLQQKVLEVRATSVWVLRRSGDVTRPRV